MSIKSLIFTVIETIVKVVIIAVAVMYIIKGVGVAFDFGYRVFADEPMSVGEGRTITVGIAENASVKDVATMLEQKGLIRDADLFVIQERLSQYHDQIQSGIFDLSTSMTASDILAVISSESQYSDEEPVMDPVQDVEEGEPEGEENLEDMPSEENALETQEVVN